MTADDDEARRQFTSLRAETDENTRRLKGVDGRISELNNYVHKEFQKLREVLDRKVMAKMIGSAVDEQLADVLERIDALEQSRDGDSSDPEAISQIRGDIVLLQQQIEERTLIINEVQSETNIAIAQLTQTRDELLQQMDVKIDWGPIQDLTDMVLLLKKQINDTRAALVQNNTVVIATHTVAEEANGLVHGLRPEVEAIKAEVLKWKGRGGGRERREVAGGDAAAADGAGSDAIEALQGEIDDLRDDLEEAREKSDGLEARLLEWTAGEPALSSLAHSVRCLKYEVRQLKAKEAARNAR
jgi:chromosome segregation ATPase